MPKDQYQATLELNQTIWDGGTIRAQKKVIAANSEVDREQWQVDMFAIEDRVNQLFFGILLLDAQLNQNDVLQDNLQRNYNVIVSQMENGIANQADLDAVKVEILQAEQSKAQLIANKRAYLEMLSAMLGETVNETTHLVKPLVENEYLITNIYRPELRLFDAQYNLIEMQKKQIAPNYLPKIGLFVQGGYGRPGLNMLDPDFSPYYIGGINLTWNFSPLYTQKNDRRKLLINQDEIAVQRETFLYNIRLEATQEINDIQKMREVMKYDNEIITLRENVRKSAEAKLANGTITVVDLMREINAENSANIDKATHEIQLLSSIYSLKNTTNN